MSESGERRSLRSHPLLVVAVGAGLLAIGQALWIWTHRRVGAIDPDEAGYIATALRFHRLLGSAPLELPRAVGGTGYAPLVPLLSVPLLWLGPDDPRTVMLALPVMMVVTAVAVAGIANRLAGPVAAMVAGLAFGAFPTVVFATQTYWFGLGAAMFLALGLWALLASERLTNRWAYAYGAAIGAMLLSRTMTLGYLPAAFAAGVVIAGRRRESWIGLVKAGLTTVLVAAPWYLAARHAVFDYLFSYGYGERAGLFGQGGPLARFDKRLERLQEGLGVALVPVAVVCLTVAAAMLAWSWWRARRDGEPHPPWPPSTRGATAIATAFALGLAALTSTNNDGVWFELPMVAILVPLVVALCARLPRVVIVPAVAVVAVAGVLQLGFSWWLIPPDADGVPLVPSTARTSQYEYGFAEYDLRFRPERRDELPEAAADWAGLNHRVERELHRITGGGRQAITMSGNFELFNTNTVQLAGELNGWTPRARVPDTVTDRAGRAADLTPTFAGGRNGQPVERILVLALHDQHLFTPDERVRALAREARSSGWRVVASYPIPGGGTVEVLRHRPNP